MIATIVFLVVTAWIGGPVEGDAALSVFSTWAIAHGQIACSYPDFGLHSLPILARPNAFIPPLYPLLSAGVLAIVHSGYSVPFPTSAQLGPHCFTSATAMYQWANRSHAILPTIRIGYLTWIALMVGTVAVLRAAGRGRNGWEPVTLLFLAIAAPVSECLTEYFHPQDLLAMGLALGSLACAIRGKWVWAGILVGLAFTSNQFALLFAAPMIVVAPKELKIKFAAAAFAAVYIISIPVIILTSGEAFSPSLIGPGFTPAVGGGTVLSETNLHGNLLFVIARVLPIVLAMSIAWWAKRRLADRVFQPLPMLSIVATALGLRLAFEFSLYGYFFMGLATMLIINDFMSGRIRGTMITWLTLVTVLYDPFPWGFASNGQSWGLSAREWLPNIFLIVAIAILLIDAARRRFRWYVLAATFFVGVTLVKWPWNNEALRQLLPTWIIQLVLIPAGIWLAISPLLQEVRNKRVSDSPVGLSSAIPGREG